MAHAPEPLEVYKQRKQPALAAKHKGRIAQLIGPPARGLTAVGPAAAGTQERTALHQACALEDPHDAAAQVRRLLETPASRWIDERDSSGQTPLAVAVARGCKAAAALLLEHGADANLAGGSARQRPLHLACAATAAGVAACTVRLLLNNGACALVRDAAGALPIHAAAAAGQLAAFACLAQHDPATLAVPNDSGATPLHLWGSHPASSAAELARLFAHGLVSCQVLNAADGQGHTPLWLALAAGNHALARVLVRHGASPLGGATLCHTPLWLGVRRGGAPLLRLLLEAWPPGGDSPKTRSRGSQFGRGVGGGDAGGPEAAAALAALSAADTGALLAAALAAAGPAQELQVLELLLQHGLNVSGPPGLAVLVRRDTPLSARALLLAHGAPVNGIAGQAVPLVLAATDLHAEAVELLLACPGVDARRVDAEGYTALDRALEACTDSEAVALACEAAYGSGANATEGHAARVVGALVAAGADCARFLSDHPQPAFAFPSLPAVLGWDRWVPQRHGARPWGFKAAARELLLVLRGRGVALGSQQRASSSSGSGGSGSKSGKAVLPLEVCLLVLERAAAPLAAWARIC